MRIFTVDRESGSSLKSKTRPVCTRSSCSRIACRVFVAVLWLGDGSVAQVPAGYQRRLRRRRRFASPRLSATAGFQRSPCLPVCFAQGDLYDAQVVERDFNSLWNTGYFDDVRIERVDTPSASSW